MQTVSFAGDTYDIPTERGDTPWSGLSDFVIAAASKAINTAGGNFTLLADINFGASFGLVSTYYKSRTANIADAGQIRLANTDTIKFRNGLNDANLSVSISSNRLAFEGSRLLIANAAEIVNADISISAAIALSKLAALSASKALVSDGSGVVSVSTTTTTELQGLHGLTASKALVTNASGILTTSATTDTEIGYVSGVTSALQTQIDAKAADSAVVKLTGDQTIAGNKTFSDPIVQNDTTNQLVLGVTRTVTVSAPTPASSSRTVTLPDLSADYSVVGTAGAQTVGGIKTLTAAPQVSPTGAGDAYIGFNINGGASWVAGADDSASDAFVISNSTTPGTDNAISISTGEVVTLSTQGIIKGTATNDSAATGFVGEYVESVISTGQNSAGSNTFGDLTSISLTAGDWDVVAIGFWEINGATWTSASIGISTTSGNDGTGLVTGSNRSIATWASSSTTPTEQSFSVPSYRQSLSGTTTIYFKYVCTSSAGTPKCRGRLSARRVR